MSPRSEEFFEQARDRLAAGREAFRVNYVVTDAFDPTLFTLAQHAQVAREGGDYQAVSPSDEEAQRYVEGAADFLAAVEHMLGT